MKISVIQRNVVLGDVAVNADILARAWAQAAEEGADLVVSAELSLTGYPVDDLGLRPSFQRDIEEAVAALAKKTERGPAFLIGAPWVEKGRLYNAALLLQDGVVAATVFKHDLPNYGPFDERRIYSSGPLSEPIECCGIKLGVMICEDMWRPDVARHLRCAGAQILIVMNGSPYETDKILERRGIARSRVGENEMPLIYANLLGGQDELLFDGGAFALDAQGSLYAQSQGFCDDIMTTKWRLDGEKIIPAEPFQLGIEQKFPYGVAADYEALVLALKDYVLKNGFQDVLLGLSGGIDSALVAVLAVDALGPSHVRTLMLPSIYTSKDSYDDAKAVAKALGCAHDILPITGVVNAVDASFSSLTGSKTEDLTHENVQARTRGLLLMALSNSSNALLLSTGNKSELSIGYATLYGDMCGGFAPIKDLYKSDVYKVLRYGVKKRGLSIPDRIFTKAPTAELRDGQRDQDNLPPYEILDDVLRGLVERDMSFATLVEQGYDYNLVRDIWKKMQHAEYKRRQGPPGPKITRRHVTKDRRYPITNGYAGS